MNQKRKCMSQRLTAILMISLVVVFPGCISDDGIIEQTNNDETETINQNENITSVENTTSVDYVGFMDNSSVYGFIADPIENFSRIYQAQNENNCTSTEHGDDWTGVWGDPWCVIDYGGMAASEGGSTTHENGELCFVDAAGESYCFNMTISNRVMWFQGDILGGQEDK